MDRTWNLTLMATDDQPETTLTNVSNEDAKKLLRALMYGPGSAAHAEVQAAVNGIRADRHEAPLAA
jgi:hypothetical protein